MRDSISLNRDGVWLDVDEARQLAEADNFEAAAALHRGGFLAGFGLRDSPAFDSWQSFQSGTLTRELGAILDRAADARAAAGDLPAAIAHARRAPRARFAPQSRPTGG